MNTELVVISRRSERHGQTATVEHAAWCRMKSRCQNPNATRFAWYGGRGIQVCERWANSFQAFLADVGRRPSSTHSLDRIDMNGHYEPSNVRWATKLTQANNTRHNRLITHDGETLTMAEWGRRLNVLPASIQQRLARGVPVAEALTRPFLRSRKR